MLASILMMISALFGALSNLCMRKSMDGKGSALGFSVVQFMVVFFFVTWIYPIQTGLYSMNLYTLIMGITCGVFLGLMHALISFSLTKGPASLTFASVNCASVAPAIIITFLFGSTIHYPYTTSHIVGSLLIVAGLVWAVSDQTVFLQRWKWMALSFFGFFFHTLYLLFTQAHALTLKTSESVELNSEWFVPIVIITASFILAVVYFFSEKRSFLPNEITWGCLGGLLNGVCTYFFMQATYLASGGIQAFIFPIFTVALIIGCNIWGQWLYDEQVNWKANCLCLLGLFSGAL